jgi:hypothetical protein
VDEKCCWSGAESQQAWVRSYPGLCRFQCRAGGCFKRAAETRIAFIPARQRFLEGDEEARALMGQILAEQGFVVTAVGDESTALRRIETKPLRCSSPRSGCRDRSMA